METKINKNQKWSELILQQVSAEDIFRRYFGLDPSKKRFKSPFRNDNNPGCNFRYSRKGILYLVDWANESYYNCFSAVMELYNCTFTESLKIISQDFGLDINTNKNTIIRPANIKKKLEEVQKIKELVEIDAWEFGNKHDFSKEDLEYWNSFGISKQTLETFNVFSLNYALYKGIEYGKSEPGNPLFAYFYPYSKRIKTYAPLSPLKMKKWGGDSTIDDISGIDNLSYSGSTIFITKSMKDVMVLYEMGYEAIALNGEGYKFISEFPGDGIGNISVIMERILRSYDNVYVLFDNDAPGKKASNKRIQELNTLCAKLNIPNKAIQIFLESAKDISDSVKKIGVEPAKQELIKLMAWTKERQLP